MADDDSIDEKNPANEMTFLEHLEEMRGVIIKSLAVFTLAFIVVIAGFYYFNRLMLFPLNQAKKILTIYAGKTEAPKAGGEAEKIGPVYLLSAEGEIQKKEGPFYIVAKDETISLSKNPPAQNSWVSDIKLRSMSITTPIFVWLSVGFLGSLGLSLPAIMYFIARFIMPGLTKSELKMLAPGAVCGTLLFFFGAAFAFLFMLPMGIAFMAWMSQSMQLEMFPDAMSYYSMVIFLTIATGLTFELPLLQFILIYLGALDVNWLKKNRRTVFLIILVAAAVVTPPDVITQVSLTIPLYLMYEIALRAGVAMRRRKLAREARREREEREREERERAQYVKGEAKRRIAEEREESEYENAKAGAAKSPESNPEDGSPHEDRAYEELDNLDADYDYALDEYLDEYGQTEAYIDYGAPEKSVADFSPDWSLNKPDSSFMSPDWSLNAEPAEGADMAESGPTPPDGGGQEISSEQPQSSETDTSEKNV